MLTLKAITTNTCTFFKDWLDRNASNNYARRRVKMRRLRKSRAIAGSADNNPRLIHYQEIWISILTTVAARPSEFNIRWFGRGTAYPSYPTLPATRSA
jgi:hypothetical protein